MKIENLNIQNKKLVMHRNVLSRQTSRTNCWNYSHRNLKKFKAFKIFKIFDIISFSENFEIQK